MNKSIAFLTGLLVLSLGFESYSQEQKDSISKPHAHFITGIGGSYVNVIDEGISPLLYNGIGGSAILGLQQEKPKNINLSTIKFDFNNPKSSISNAEMYTYRLEGYYQRYWKLKSDIDSNWKIRPGFDVTAKWALRQHLNYTNNSQHVETRFSISPALMIANEFVLLDRQFEYGAFFKMPIVTYATRPIFASTKFPASINKEEAEFLDYLAEGSMISFGKYFKWYSQCYLYYPFKNGNGIRLDYHWSFESYKALNPIKTAEHTLVISTFLKI